MSSVAVVAAAAIAVAGCATLPATGVGATGQPLGVIVESQHYDVAQNQLVGQVHYRDATGRPLGTANVYETRTVHMTNVDWQTTQGGNVVDEEDFLRITGDIETARALHDHRMNGWWMNRIGFVVMVASTAGFVAGRIAAGGQRSDVPAALGFIGGIALTGYGYRQAKTPHSIDLDRARTEIARYNQQIAAPRAP